MSRIEQIERMLASEPNDAFLNFGLAMEYTKAGRDEEAIRQFSRVLEVDSGYVAAYSQKANLLLKMSRAAEAASTLRDGIAIAKGKGEAHAAAEMGEVLATIEAAGG